MPVVLSHKSEPPEIPGRFNFWPEAEKWWRPDIWWDDEAAREGMGLMIVSGVFIFLAVMRSTRAYK